MLANQTNFQTLLTGTKVFIIPIFQRRYSWSRKEWQALWEDLMLQYEAISNNQQKPDGEGHFMGSVVLHPAPGPASTVARYLLIDGQQRLTTVLVLLASLRDVRAATIVDWPKAAYDDVYLKNSFKPKDPYRLMPGVVDRDAFRATLFEENPTGQVGNAYIFFSKKLKQLGGNLDYDRMEQAILLRLLAVEITTSSTDNVNHIFHTLNFAGMKLSAVDLIRNYILMQLPPDKAELAHSDLWMPLERQLTDKQLHRYLFAQLVRRDRTVRQRDIYVPFEKQMQMVMAEGDPQTQLLDELQRLGREAELFRLLEDPTNSRICTWASEELRFALKELSDWGAAPPVPLELELLSRLSLEPALESDVLECLQDLLSFLIRRALTGMLTNNLNRILSPIPSSLRTGEPLASQVRTALAGPGQQWPSDEELLEQGPRVALYRTSRPPQVKYILSRLEMSLEPKEPVAFQGLTIEHILPQKITPDWAKALEAEGSDAELALTRRHCLGNLTLTGYNSELAQKPFDVKRVALADSSLSMNRDISRNPRWGVLEIDERGEQLLRLASRRWLKKEQSTPDSSVAPEESARPLEEVLLALPGDRWVSVDSLADVLALPSALLVRQLADVEPSLAVRVLSAEGRLPEYPADQASRLKTQLLTQGVDPAGHIAGYSKAMSADELQRLLEELDAEEGSGEDWDEA